MKPTSRPMIALTICLIALMVLSVPGTAAQAQIQQRAMAAAASDRRRSDPTAR